MDKQKARIWSLLVAEGALCEHVKSLGQYEALLKDNFIAFLEKTALTMPEQFLSAKHIGAIHLQIFKSIMTDAGKLHNKQMAFGGITGSPPQNFVQDLEALDARMASIFNDAKTVEDKIRALAIQHVSLISIHPFADGNGRTTRAIIEHGIRAIRAQHAIDFCKPSITPDKKGYICALNLARTHEQIGPLSAIIANQYGIAYNAPLMYKAPFKLNTAQQAHDAKATSQSINAEKKLFDNVANNTKGYWLSSIKPEQLIAHTGGKYTKQGELIANILGTKKQQTIGEALSYISTLKTNGIKSTFFNKFDAAKFDGYTKQAFSDFREVLPKAMASTLDLIVSQALSKKAMASQVDAKIDAFQASDFYKR